MDGNVGGDEDDDDDGSNSNKKNNEKRETSGVVRFRFYPKHWLTQFRTHTHTSAHDRILTRTIGVWDTRKHRNKTTLTKQVQNLPLNNAKIAVIFMCCVFSLRSLAIKWNIVQLAAFVEHRDGWEHRQQHATFRFRFHNKFLAALIGNGTKLEFINISVTVTVMLARERVKERHAPHVVNITPKSVVS